ESTLADNLGDAAVGAPSTGLSGAEGSFADETGEYRLERFPQIRQCGEDDTCSLSQIPRRTAKEARGLPREGRYLLRNPRERPGDDHLPDAYEYGGRGPFRGRRRRRLCHRGQADQGADQ